MENKVIISLEEYNELVTKQKAYIIEENKYLILECIDQVISDLTIMHKSFVVELMAKLHENDLLPDSVKHFVGGDLSKRENLSELYDMMATGSFERQ